MKNRLLGRRRGKSNGYLEKRGKNNAVVQGPDLFMLLHIISNYEKLPNIMTEFVFNGHSYLCPFTMEGELIVNCFYINC